MTFLTAVTVGLESCLSRNVEDLQNLRDDQWDAFKSGLLSALRNIGLLPGARNVYGLRDGYVLCYWDSQSEQLHQSILFRLRKEDTLYKMFFHGVSVIHVYTLISLEKNQGPFRSSLVEASLVETFKFAKAHDSALAIPERLSGPSTVSPQPRIPSSVPTKRRRSDSSESFVLERLNTQTLLTEVRNKAYQARQEIELLIQERARHMAHIERLDAEVRVLRVSRQLTMQGVLKEGNDEIKRLEQGLRSRREIAAHEEKGQEEIVKLEAVIRDQEIAFEASRDDDFDRLRGAVSESEIDQMKTRISQLEKVADVERQKNVFEDALKGSLQAERETLDRFIKSQESLQAIQKEYALSENRVAQVDAERMSSEAARQAAEKQLEQEVESGKKALILLRQEAEEVVSKERSLRESVENKLDTVRQSVKGVFELLG